MPVQCALCQIDVDPSHEADDIPLCDNHLRWNPEFNKATNIPAAIDDIHDKEKNTAYHEYAKTKLEQEQPTVGE